MPVATLRQAPLQDLRELLASDGGGRHDPSLYQHKTRRASRVARACAGQRPGPSDLCCSHFGRLAGATGPWGRAERPSWAPWLSSRVVSLRGATTLEKGGPWPRTSSLTGSPSAPGWLRQTREVLETMIDLVSKELAHGGEVALAGFGKFSVSHRSARTGRNPSTGETIQIAPSKAAKFSGSGAAQEELEPIAALAPSWPSTSKSAARRASRGPAVAVPARVIPKAYGFISWALRVHKLGFRSGGASARSLSSIQVVPEHMKATDDPQAHAMARSRASMRPTRAAYVTGARRRAVVASDARGPLHRAAWVSDTGELLRRPLGTRRSRRRRARAADLCRGPLPHRGDPRRLARALRPGRLARLAA